MLLFIRFTIKEKHIASKYNGIPAMEVLSLVFELRIHLKIRPVSLEGIYSPLFPVSPLHDELTGIHDSVHGEVYCCWQHDSNSE